MSAPEKDLSAKNITFFSACRENTGRHLLDSGGAYGRIYDRPAVTPETPPVVWSDVESSATLSTPHLLDANWKIDRELQKRCEAFEALEENEDLNWFELGEDFCKKELELKRKIRGNVYNDENDLSQVFVYEVWNTEDSNRDEIYPDDTTVTVFYIHTGCDVRGGYGRPIFCRPTGGYSIPVDLQCEYRIVGEPGIPQSEVNWDLMQLLDERWMRGWSSYPYGQLRDDVEEWHKDTATVDKYGTPTVEVTLKTGERVIVGAFPPFET